MKMTIPMQRLKMLLTQYIVFMAPAMLIAAKGYADLWSAAAHQPYIAMTLLMLSTVEALMLLTLASVFRYLAHRHFWIPSGKLILLVAGMKLYFDYSMGTTLGVEWLAAPAVLWCLWGCLAYRKLRAFQNSPE